MNTTPAGIGNVATLGFGAVTIPVDNVLMFTARKPAPGTDGDAGCPQPRDDKSAIPT